MPWHCDRRGNEELAGKTSGDCCVISGEVHYRLSTYAATSSTSLSDSCAGKSLGMTFDWGSLIQAIAAASSLRRRSPFKEGPMPPAPATPWQPAQLSR